MRVANTDTLYHQNKSPENILQTEEKDKKYNYLKYCLHKHCRLSHFVVSMNGLFGMEAEAMLKHIAILLATKSEAAVLTDVRLHLK